MKKVTNRILSFLTAFAMVIGVLVAPFTSASAAGAETTDTVTVHKILTTKTNLDFVGKKVTITPKEGKATSKVLVEKDGKYYLPTDLKTPVEEDDFVKALKGEDLTEGSTALIEDVKFEGQIGIDGTNYDGTQIDGIDSYFGTGSEEIDGVFFALKFDKGHKGFTDVQKADGVKEKKYTSATNLENEEPANIEAGKYVKADPADKTKPLVLTKTVDEVETKYLVATDNIDEAVGGKTAANGLKLITSGLKGEFEIDEIHDKSSYKGTDGESLTEMKAVPVKITLPLVNAGGVVSEAHVYPKNIEEKPQIDKNFGKENDLKEQKKDNFDLSTETADGKKPVVGPKEGAKYENYSKEKSLVSAEIGKEIPYEVKTQIPAQSKLATAYWTDEMTEGLTFDQNSVKIKIGGEEAATTDYTLDTTGNGFMLRLTKEGLAKVNNKENPVEVEITYTAKVNGNVKPDKTDKNKVVFNYGNNPSKGNTPESNKPGENGELKVTKTWDDGTWAPEEKATFVLIDKETGKRVTADDLVAPNGNADDATFKAYKDSFKNEVELGYNETDGASYTWKYLDKTKDYKAVEVKISSGSEAEYIVETDAQGEKVAGEIKVTNHKSNNPTPLEPTSPEVVTYGKKFVKTNEDGTERLAGAEFYVKNSENKYLVAKTSAEKEAANIDVSEKKAALDKAVKAYNDLTAEQQKTDTEKKAAINDAQDAYNKAFKKAAQGYKWEASKDNALVLVSDSQGRFEITGLDFGEYNLVEKTAPEGYAKRSDEPAFKAEKDSYTTKEVNIKYTTDDQANNAQQVINKKVTIPQTGGIGSLIFIVAGLAIMGVAFVAMKRRNAVEA